MRRGATPLGATTGTRNGPAAIGLWAVFGLGRCYAVTVLEVRAFVRPRERDGRDVELRVREDVVSVVEDGRAVAFEYRAIGSATTVVKYQNWGWLVRRQES